MARRKTRYISRDANEPPIIAGLRRCGWGCWALNDTDMPDWLIAKLPRGMYLLEIKNLEGKGTAKLRPGQERRRRELELFGVKIVVATDLDSLLRSLGDVG